MLKGWGSPAGHTHWRRNSDLVSVGMAIRVRRTSLGLPNLEGGV